MYFVNLNLSGTDFYYSQNLIRLAFMSILKIPCFYFGFSPHLLFNYKDTNTIHRASVRLKGLSSARYTLKSTISCTSVEQASMIRMETTVEDYEANNSHLYDLISTTDDDEDDKYYDETSEEDYDSSSTDSSYRCYGGNKNLSGSRLSWLREWDRVFPLLSALCLFIDPTFLYAISLNGDSLCFYVDGWLALGVSLFRFITDGLHVWNIWRRYFSKDYKRRSFSATDAYLRSIYGDFKSQNFKGKLDFFIYVFTVLPLPQVTNYYFLPSIFFRVFTKFFPKSS